MITVPRNMLDPNTVLGESLREFACLLADVLAANDTPVPTKGFRCELADEVHAFVADCLASEFVAVGFTERVAEAMLSDGLAGVGEKP